ncbi:hypothetical protein 4P_00091 [Pseudomonas phage 4P]|nr:hypothetical protein 4P_00091 [Pseudomonas phage 4P]
MPDLVKLSHRQYAVLLEMHRNSGNPIHSSPTNSTLKALRRMGLVELSWKDSVAGYMFGRQPCWSITDAGRKRAMAMAMPAKTMGEEQSEICSSVPEFEKTDSSKLYEALETISELEKKFAESEKRGAELAASYCDGVVGDEYGHPYCRYKVERDAALAEVERLRESKGDPSGSFDRCVKMMYERDENAKRLDAALARVAELEGKLTDWVREGFRLNEALAVAKAQPSVPEGWKLVPMDPTSQMTSVGQSLRYDAVNSIGEIYRQMLAVAPSPINPAAHPQPCQQPQAHPARCGCER